MCGVIRCMPALVLLIWGHGEAVASSLSPGDILTANFFGGGSIIRVDPITGAQAVVASGGNFRALSGIALDPSGAIFVTDLIQDEIIRVDPATGIQTVVAAGNNLIFPVGIAIDAADDLLVADRSAHEIIRINPITGEQVVVSAGGNLNGMSSGPDGIAIDAAGNIVVSSDRSGVPGFGIIVRVNPVTGAQTVISEGGSLSSLNAIAIDMAGNYWVTNGFGSIIRVNSSTGAQSVVSSGGSLVIPIGIAIDAEGRILTDSAPNPPGVSRIIRVDPVTGSQTILSSGGALLGPAGIAVVPSQAPEPSTILPCGIGLFAVWGIRRRGRSLSPSAHDCGRGNTRERRNLTLGNSRPSYDQ